MLDRAHSLLKSAFLLLFGLVVAFILAEVIVRVFYPEPVLPRFVLDAGYGVRANQPKVITRHYVPGDYDVEISTNSSGMRGKKEYSIDKSQDVYRIAVLGDSFGFGFGVNDNEVISVVLEDILNSSNICGSYRYEVLNFSVSGFGQAEQLVTYREKVRAYGADEVVLFYFSNDIGNNAVSRLFELTKAGELRRTGNAYLPGVRLREILYGNPATRWLFTTSQAWNFVRNRLSAVVQKSLLNQQGLDSFSDTDAGATDLTRELLLQFASDITKDDARADVFVIPEKDMSTNFPLMEKELVTSGVRIVDGRGFLLPADYYDHDGHWRAIGHRKAATALAELIAASVECPVENKLMKSE